MRGLPYCNEFNKFNNTGARMIDSIYHMTPRTTLKLITLKILPYISDRHYIEVLSNLDAFYSGHQ